MALQEFKINDISINVKAGDRYQHYKGNLYEVLDVATHTETGEKLVIYKDINHPEKVGSPVVSMLKYYI